MSTPKTPDPAKLVISLFMNDKEILDEVLLLLQDQFGETDRLSPWFDFDYTDYYHKEMGSPLYRRVVVFKNLIDQSRLAEIKLATNRIEKRWENDEKRSLNIDPGYLLLSRFILATGKDYAHRIYIGQGIYADLTLMYKKRTILSLGVELSRLCIQRDAGISFNGPGRLFSGAEGVETKDVNDMIKSMTAYAGASHTENGIQCDIEMRTYNSKHLDIALYLHRAFNRYEDLIKKRIAEKLARGRVEVRMDIEDQSEDAIGFDLDIKRAKAYHSALKQLQDHFNLSSDITLDTLLGAKEVILPAEKEQDESAIERAISEALTSALDQLDGMRSREGENLAEDLNERLCTIETTLDLVERAADGLPCHL